MVGRGGAWLVVVVVVYSSSSSSKTDTAELFKNSVVLVFGSRPLKNSENR